MSTPCLVFLQPLSNVTVAANGSPVNLTCTVMADNLFWFVNDTLYNQNTMEQLLFGGFQFSQLSYCGNKCVSGRVSVNVSVRNNTDLWCQAQNFGQTSILSRATISIAGKKSNY